MHIKFEFGRWVSSRCPPTGRGYHLDCPCRISDALMVPLMDFAYPPSFLQVMTPTAGNWPSVKDNGKLIALGG